MPFAKSLSGFRPGARRELLNCTRDRSIAGAQQLVEIAVHHYFGHRTKLKQLEFRHLLKERTGGLFSASAISTKSFAACASKCGSGASKDHSTTWGRSGLTLAWMN
jgi:hypothetical protein